MKIVEYNSSEIISAEYNPRQLTKEQYSNLKDSLERFGLVDPLIINKNKDRKNILVGGHQRLKIARAIGMDKIPCVEVDLTLDQEKELNVRLNKNVGEWDYDSLANYFDVDDLMDWGFTDDELQFYEDEPEQGLIDDEIPEVEEAITKQGDLWILGDHRLLCGDATNKEDVDILMDGNKADMVFTDPPYGVDYDGGSKKRKKLKDDHIGTNIYSKVIPIISENCIGACYTWFAGSYPFDLYNSVYKYGDIHSLIIWVKNNSTFNMNIHYKQKHEPCLYWKPKNKTLRWAGSNNQDTVWNFDRDSKNKLHPTQKPVELATKAISNHNADIIMDLFLGSGSTLIACEKTNRKCYGMELDPHYCDVIVKRWEEFTGKKAILNKGVESNHDKIEANGLTSLPNNYA
jgi:DNA modification methylase